MADENITVDEMIALHGASATGIAMLVQLAEWLEFAKAATIEGDARRDLLTWLKAWREVRK